MHVAVGPATLYVEQHGSGPDVALVHGVGASSARVWERVLPALAARYRVLAYDLRGFGRSTNPGGVQRIPQHAADLVALLDHFGIARAHLVGYSTGGQIVQEMALAHPDRVRSLALVATNAGLPQELHPDYEERLALVEGGGMAAYVERQLGRAFTPAFLATHPEVADWYRREFQANDPVAYVGLMRNMLRLRLHERLPTLRCPTLVLSGEHDRSPMSGRPPLELPRELQRLIPGAELVVLPDAGHYVLVEQPEAFVGALSAFIDRVERA